MYRVLVVDDEKIEREGIKFLLSREEGEFEISEASNGRQALEILRNEEIDLLLTDIKMPHMDGLELAKKAKEEKEELQIVIFSGYNDFSFAQEAIRYGVKEYVLKPVDPDIFSETLEKVRSEIDKNKNRKIRDQKEQDFLQQYFLQNYIYTGKKKFWKKPEKCSTWIPGISGTVPFWWNPPRIFLILQMRIWQRICARNCGEYFSI